MSNNFWIGLAAIGAGAYFLWPKKAAAGTASNPSMVGQGTTLTGAGTSAYGQFPGLTQGGAAGVNNTAGGNDPSGSLDNSRVFDPYAQSQAGSLSGIDPATGLPYMDRSMLLDKEVMYSDGWQQGDGYQYRSVSE